MLPLQAFKNFVDQHGLFNPSSRILLGVSGGKDSVLMTHLFKAAGYEIGLAHCNFNLRGEESRRDEGFVRMLALTSGVPFYVVRFDTKEYAARQKISTQMAARDLRYHWFEETRAENGYDLIALAHHMNDNVETVLLNLTRGTGIGGLHGILPKREKLIRPMLFLSRAEIDTLVETLQLDYVEDSSNPTLNYARNKIRHQVVPVLSTLNPNLEHTFAQNIQRFIETEMVLQQVVATLSKDVIRKEQGAVHLSLQLIRHLMPQRLLLFELLKPYNFTELLIGEILGGLNKQSGTAYYSATHQATIDREDLIISELTTGAEPELVMIHHDDMDVVFLNQQLVISRSDVVYFEKELFKAFVDARLLIFPLVLRSRQEGDKFKPLGMKAFKKLSDFLIDEKVPLTEKDKVPLLVNGNGEVIWVGGYRQDDRYKVTGATQQVAVFELKKINNS